MAVERPTATTPITMAVPKCWGLLALALLCSPCLYVVAGEGQDCSGKGKLTVFEGSTEIPKFPCVFYAYKKPWNKDIFPVAGLLQGDPAEKTHDFNATMNRKIVPPLSRVFDTYTEIVYEWSGPETKIGQQTTKGYLLLFTEEPMDPRAVVTIWLYDLRGFNFTSRKNVRFQVNRLETGSSTCVTSAVKFQSLPPPADADAYSGPYCYVHLIPPALNSTVTPNPSDWVVPLSAKLARDRGTIEMHFNFPEMEHLPAYFELYRVALLQQGIYFPEIVGTTGGARTSVDSSNLRPFGNYTFNHVPLGVYRIRIAPVDLHRYVKGFCHCFTLGKPPQPPRMCASCKFTETADFPYSEFDQPFIYSAKKEGTASTVSARNGVWVVVVAVVVSIAASTAMVTGA